jgi:hypothetical protein
MKINYFVIDEGNCDVEQGLCDLDMHFHQRMIGWVSQGWSVQVWPLEDASNDS